MHMTTALFIVRTKMILLCFVIVSCVLNRPPPKCIPPPPTIYTPQIMYPRWLNGHFAKICTPFSQIQANETRTNSGYVFNTAAQPFTRRMQ